MREAITRPTPLKTAPVTIHTIGPEASRPTI